MATVTMVIEYYQKDIPELINKEFQTSILQFYSYLENSQLHKEFCIKSQKENIQYDIVYKQEPNSNLIFLAYQIIGGIYNYSNRGWFKIERQPY